VCRAESYQNLINGLFENLETFDITGLSDFFNLFPLAPCKSILNTFVYEIYQRIFILFELSVKHTLSDFLLPYRCHKGLSNRKNLFYGIFQVCEFTQTLFQDYQYLHYPFYC